MKDEIKEILDKLQNYENYKFRSENGRRYKEIEAWEIELLLDYITNLEQENKVLLEKYSTIQILYNSSKLKNEKAVEYNQQIIKDTKDFYRPTEDIIYSGDTLIDIAMNNINILQGGGE